MNNDLGLIDWYKVMDINFRNQLDMVRSDNWEMLELDTEQKIELLEYLKTYFVKIEEYEICNEIQYQLDKLK